MEESVERYVQRIKKELTDILQNQEYIGNIEFRVNIKFGGLVNMNITSEKCVKI